MEQPIKVEESRVNQNKKKMWPPIKGSDVGSSKPLKLSHQTNLKQQVLQNKKYFYIHKEKEKGKLLCDPKLWRWGINPWIFSKKFMWTWGHLPIWAKERDYEWMNEWNVPFHLASLFKPSVPPNSSKLQLKNVSLISSSLHTYLTATLWPLTPPSTSTAKSKSVHGSFSDLSLNSSSPLAIAPSPKKSLCIPRSPYFPLPPPPPIPSPAQYSVTGEEKWTSASKQTPSPPAQFCSSNWRSPRRFWPGKWEAACSESRWSPPRRAPGGGRFFRRRRGVCTWTGGKLGTLWGGGLRRRTWRRCGGWGGWWKARESSAGRKWMGKKMIIWCIWERISIEFVGRRGIPNLFIWETQMEASVKSSVFSFSGPDDYLIWWEQEHTYYLICIISFFFFCFVQILFELCFFGQGFWCLYWPCVSPPASTCPFDEHISLCFWCQYMKYGSSFNF